MTSIALMAAAALVATAPATDISSWRFSRDGRTWKEVSVPHDWAIGGPFDKKHDMQVVAIRENNESKAAEKTGRTGALPWIGRGEYRTSVEIPEGTGYAALLFDGAMSEPEVFCDGVKVGEWKNGYNAFEVPLPPKAGRHEIAVRLTNRLESSRWYPGAGLIRPVRLVLGGAVGVKTWGNAIWTPDLKTVRVKTECRGQVGRLVYRILDGSHELAVSETGTLTGAFEPWSPEAPKLYTLVTEAYDATGALAERRTDRFGVRTLEYGKDGFFLNGRKRKFNGVCMHHDLGPLGAAFDRDAFCRQMTLLKEMGCDSLRTSHNMPSEGQLEVCDELGILVMAESFDSWARAKVKNGYNLFFDDWWRRDLENLVKKCRNHPSVVMWSIGNEICEQAEPSGVATIRAMQELCHRFDPDPARKVTQGLSWMPHAIRSGWNAAMEIPAVTYRLPFYGAMYTNSPAGFVLGGETASTLSTRGFYRFPVEPLCDRPFPDGQCSGYDVEYCNWSNLPDDDWAVQEDNAWTIGEFVWTGFDYLGEPFPYDNYWPSRSSYFGIFDLAGIPKDRYWLYRSHWNKSSHTLHLVPHWTFPDRVGKVTPVYCYTDFDEAELFVNGWSQGRRRKDRSSRLDRFRLRWNDVVYAPGELKVVAYDANGRPAMTETVRTAGAPVRVELEKRRFGKLLFVTAKVVDKDGTLVPDADSELIFYGGKGLRFKAVCNGDATSLESFVVPHMKAFHGQLVAIFEGEGDEVSVVWGGEKNLKVLMIGNSFSISNIREMPSVASAMGCPLDLSSLCIGGCSLERHWNNLVASTNAAFRPYGFERNVRGKTLFMDVPSNLLEVLKSDRWDVITVQQASHFSWRGETYEPYLGDFVRELKRLQPQAEIVFQETWSYTPWDRRLAKWGITADEMYAKIREACQERVVAKGMRVIPTGTAVDLYRKALPVVYAENSFGGDPCGGRWGGEFVRDEKTGKWKPGKGLDVFHLGYEGEYLQALVWTSALFGVDVTRCPYVPKYVTNPDRAEKMKRCAQETVNRQRR